jgi:hypothetical protein
MDWQSGLSSRSPALQALKLQIKPQSIKKKKEAGRISVVGRFLIPIKPA